MAKRRKTAGRATPSRAKVTTRKPLSKGKAGRGRKPRTAALKPSPKARSTRPKRQGMIANMVDAAKEAVGLRTKLQDRNTFED